MSDLAKRLNDRADTHEEGDWYRGQESMCELLREAAAALRIEGMEDIAAPRSETAAKVGPTCKHTTCDRPDECRSKGFCRMESFDLDGIPSGYVHKYFDAAPAPRSASTPKEGEGTHPRDASPTHSDGQNWSRNVTDLEMTKLCAVAMGFKLVYPNEGAFPISIESSSAGMYDPLKNDSQAMELVKKFGLTLDPLEDVPPFTWRVVVALDGDWDKQIEAEGKGLNRAIVECVAKIRSALDNGASNVVAAKRSTSE